MAKEIENRYQYLSFIETKGHFKWIGGESDLKLLVEETTDETTDDNWEEDLHHNMLTYKSKDTIIKWYRGTKTLMVQGNKHLEYKRKLHGILESESRTQNPMDEGPNETTTDLGRTDRVEVEECSCGCKAVLDTLKKLEQSVGELQVKILGDTPPQNVKTNNQTDLEAEIKYLRERTTKLEEQNSTLISTNKCLRKEVATLESERESLITANRILYEDMKSNKEFNGENEYANSTPAHHYKPQGNHANCTRHKPANNNAPRDDESNADSTNHSSVGAPDPEEDRENEGWTKVQRKRNTEDILLIGDSMIRNLEPSRMSKKKIKKIVYSGSQLHEIKAKESNLPTIGVQTVIIHAGTNNMADPNQTPTDIASKLDQLAMAIQEKENNCNVIISSIITRNDNDFDTRTSSINSELNKLCKARKWVFVDNSNIDHTCLNRSGVHLNTKGDSLLATNLISALRGKSNSRQGRSRTGKQHSNFQNERKMETMWEFMQMLGRLR